MSPSHANQTRTEIAAHRESTTASIPIGTIPELIKATLVACLIASPILGMSGFLAARVWREQRDQAVAFQKLSHAHAELIAAPALPTLAVADAAHGRDLFTEACVACHGADARGITGLGKNLVESNFVANLSDDQLRQFLVDGRPDARPIGMPPKGGRTDFGEPELRHLVAYLRGVQDPRRMPVLPVPQAATAKPTEQEQAAALAAAGGDAELAGYIASGKKLFNRTCIACHGADGVGIKGNGKALVHNDFIKSLSDDDLLAFVKQGRAPTDSKNTTGIQMPPRGGNPALTDDDLLDIIAYLRTLQAETPASAASK